jgi:hypothetical protein
MKARLVFLMLPLLMACERNPAAPTVEENRQLDEAGQMLNAAPANLDAVDDYGLGNTNEADEPLGS